MERGGGGNRFEYATMDAYFFKNQRQNSPFSKISGYALTGPEATIALSFRLKNIHQKCDAKQFRVFFCLLNLFLSSVFRLRRRGCSNSLVAFTTETCTILDMGRRISLKKRLFDGKCASKTTSASTHRETPNW